MYAALLTSFIRRPDDGPVGTETCSLPFNKYDVPDVNCFIILIITSPRVTTRREDILITFPTSYCGGYSCLLEI
jgi:hypothetical protein